jgi:hypothetical protein
MRLMSQYGMGHAALQRNKKRVETDSTFVGRSAFSTDSFDIHFKHSAFSIRTCPTWGDQHMDGTRNLMVARGEKSVWDKPTLAASLSNYDRERWLMAAWGSGLAMIGARRGGFTGGLTAMLGATLAVRAAMGRHDPCGVRLVDRTAERGWL